MKRETENILVLLVGVAMALIVLSGEFTRYVKPGLLPWLVATAALLVVLSVAAIVADVRGRDHAHHDHAHRSGLAWLLVLPIVLLIFVKPPPIQAQRSTPLVSTSSTASLQFPPLPGGPAPEVPLPDVVMRAANDKAHSLTDRAITVTAFLLNEPAGPDLGRVVIICCAADAQLARIHLRGPAAAAAAGLPDNTWVRAVGVVTLAPPPPDQAPIPTLTASSVTRIDAPPNPYAYPS